MRQHDVDVDEADEAADLDAAEAGGEEPAAMNASMPQRAKLRSSTTDASEAVDDDSVTMLTTCHAPKATSPTLTCWEVPSEDTSTAACLCASTELAVGSGAAARSAASSVG